MLPYAVRSLSSPLESNRRRALRTLAVKASAETPAIDTILDALATDAASLRTLLGWATARSPDENCRVSSPPPDDALVGLAVSMLRRCAARDGGVAALRAVGASALIEGAVKRGAGDDIDRALATLLSEVSSGEASDAGVVASFAAAEAAPFDGVDTEDFSVTSRASLRRSAAPISDPVVRPPSAWEEAGSTLPPAPASEIDETVSAAEGWRFAPVRLCQRDQQQLFELQMAMRMSVENLSLRAGGVSEWIAAQKSAVSSCAEGTALLDAGVPAQALLQGAVGLGSSRPSAGLAVIHGLLSLVRCPLVSLSTSKAHPDQIPVPLAALRALSGVVDRLQRAVAESFDPELAVEVADPDALGRSDADTLVRAVEMQHRLPICHAAATFFCAVAPLLKRHMSSSVERLGAGRSHDASSLPFFALALSTARRLMAMLHEPEALPRRRHVALDRLRISAAMDSLASVALYHNERCVGLLRSAPRATRAMRTQDDEVVPSNAITVALIQLFVDALSTAVDGDDGSRVTRGRGHNALSQIALTAAFSPIVAATRPELHRTATAWLKEHDGGAAWETLSRAQAQAQASSGSVESAVAEEEEVAGPYAPPQESKLASEFVEGWSQLRHGVGVPPPPLAPYDAMARAALEQLSACSTSRSFVDALRTLRAMSGVMPALGRAFADGALPVRDLHPCFARFYEARPIGEGDYLALYEVLLLCEEVVLPSVFGRTDAVSAVVVAARTLQACAALLTQHAAQSFGTDVRRPAVVALDMRAAVLRTACCCAKRAIEAASAEAGASAALKGAAADLWVHATTILFNPELLRVGDSDVLSLDLCLLLLQLGELMSLSSDAEAGAGESKEAALVQRLVSVASAMDYSDDGEQVSIRAQLKTSTRRVRVAIGCLCILSQREASRACASAWLVSGTTRWCERLAKADDPVVQATATRLLGVFIGDGDPAQSLVDSMIIDSRLSAWVVDSIALACRSDLSWLSRQSSLELGVKALVRLARNAGGDIGESSVEEAESKFTAAWSAVEEDITQLLITGPVASGVKRPGTMQNAVASAACDILCATLHTRPMPCLGALRTAQLSLHGLVGDVLAEQYSVERQAESSAYALAVRSVVLGYCDRQRDATLLTCGRIFLGQRLLWAESAPTSGSSDWVAAALSAIVYISDSKEAASSRASGGPNASVAEAFAEDQAIGLIAAALSVPESTTTLADVPEIARGPAAVSSAYAALGATALARLHACAGKGCSAVAVNRVNLTMRMVAATCGDPVWAQVIGLDGSCATTTADIVNALVLLFCEEVGVLRGSSLAPQWSHDSHTHTHTHPSCLTLSLSHTLSLFPIILRSLSHGRAHTLPRAPPPLRSHYKQRSNAARKLPRLP